MSSKYVAIGRNGGISTSTDGVTWTVAGSIPGYNLPTGSPGERGVFGQNFYMTIGKHDDGQGRLWASPNGTNWTKVADNGTTSDAWGGVAYTNGYFIVTDDGGFPSSLRFYDDNAISQGYGTDDVSTTFAAAAGDGKWWGFNKPFSPRTSRVHIVTDPTNQGQDPTNYLTPLQVEVAAYSSEDSRLVVLGREPSTPIPVSLAYSDDGGVTWTGGTTSFFGWEDVYSLHSTQDDFLAVGRAYVDPDDPSLGYENRLAASTDGINWYEVTPPSTSETIYHLQTGLGVSSGIFMVAGTGGFVATTPSPLSANPTWTTRDIGFGSTDVDILIASFVVSNSGDTYIDISASTSQQQETAAYLTYTPAVSTTADSLSLYRVSKDYRWETDGEIVPAMPQSDDGKPFYTDIYQPGGSSAGSFSTQPGILPYHSEVVEEWGKIGIFIDDTDITFYRDTPTVIESISWQEFGNYEALSLMIPSLTVYDKQALITPSTSSGTGGGILASAVPWLRENKVVKIVRLTPTDDLEIIWMGSISGIDLEDNGLGVRITANGLIYDASTQLLPPKISPTQIVARDAGVLAAEALNSLDTNLGYALPKSVGVNSIKTPDWSKPLDYIRGFQGIGAPPVWVDESGVPDVAGRSQSNLYDLISGQEGLDISLDYDANAPVTVIYGRGKWFNGQEWRNLKYQYPAPGTKWYDLDIYDGTFYQYPFDDLTKTIKNGDKSTDLPPVRPIQFRYNSLGNYVGLSSEYAVADPWESLGALVNLLADAGYISTQDLFAFAEEGLFYNDTIEQAVRDFQTDKSLDATGVVDYITWSYLIGVNDLSEGAYIEPLYVSPLIDPSSPSYDPTVKRVEQYIDFGENIDVAEARIIAEKIAMRDMIRYNTGTPAIYKQRKSVTGTLTLSICPPQDSRWSIKPGDRVRLWSHIFSPIPADEHTQPTGTTFEGGGSAGSLLLYVKKIEWSLGDTPSVTLTVSSRDLEYSELEAAKNRAIVSAAERALNVSVKISSGQSRKNT